jgi:hypothetical protein
MVEQCEAGIQPEVSFAVLPQPVTTRWNSGVLEVGAIPRACGDGRQVDRSGGPAAVPAWAGGGWAGGGWAGGG